MGRIAAVSRDGVPLSTAGAGTVGIPDFAYGLRFLGHTDQGGRGDGVQVMVSDGHAYVGHMFSGGVTILDVRHPRHPHAVGFLPAAPGTWNLHLQVADGLLLVIDAVDLFAAPAFADEASYYGRSVGEVLGENPPAEYSAGMRVYDLADPGAPRQIGSLSVDGFGLHRIWYVGGRWAYASALLHGFSDYVLVTIDMADPARPRLAGSSWLPGMDLARGERPTWPREHRYGLHHAIVAGDLAYGCWRDGGLTVHDVSDPTRPELLVHRNWCPPFGGGTHTALPLPGRELLVVADEGIADDCADQVKYTWVFDVRVPANPVSISTFPRPPRSTTAPRARTSDRTTCTRTGRAASSASGSCSPRTRTPASACSTSTTPSARGRSLPSSRRLLGGCSIRVPAGPGSSRAVTCSSTRTASCTSPTTTRASTSSSTRARDDR